MAEGLYARHEPTGSLLHRVWGVDVLARPRCGRTMHLIATITDRAVIGRILERVGLSADEVTTERGRGTGTTRAGRREARG